MPAPAPVLAPWAHITLEEFKGECAINPTDTSNDAQNTGIINSVSSLIERYTGTRLMYRGIPDSPNDDNIVASVAIADGALTIAAQPLAPCRTPIVTITDADDSITAGTLTITGLDADGNAQVERVDLPTVGRIWRGMKAYSSFTSFVLSGTAGVTAVVDKIKVGSASPYYEYHTILKARSEVFTLEAPVHQSIFLHEDSNREYSQSHARLILDTDYIVDKAAGRLKRVTGSVPLDFLSGVRVLRHVYTAGFLDDGRKNNVPGDLKRVCAQLCAFFWREIERKNQGVSDRIDMSAAVTRFANHMLTGSHLNREQRAELSGYRRPRSRTAETDDIRQN